MPHVEHTFREGGHERGLLFERVWDALYSALSDLHDGDAAPETITWGGRVLYDAAAVRRVYAACRAELVATPWQVPAGLEAVARREVLRP